jgi:hypothetical protein
MRKKIALLVVAEGRAVSDVLALFYVKPQAVHVITSKEGWDSQHAFIDIARCMGCQLDIQSIDAYNFEACLQACRNSYASLSDEEWDWIFTISSSPKITGIAAYEVAKEKGISCWHVDAQRNHVVSLVKPVEIDKDKFFHLTLDDYMQIQHRIWKLEGPTDTDSYRDSVKKWATIARELTMSNSPQAAELLSLLYTKGSAKRYRTGEEFDLPPHLVPTITLKLLEDRGLLNVRRMLSGKTMGSFASVAAAQFIGTGDWLEFYVWHSAMNFGLADEQHCQWSCKVEGFGMNTDCKVENEFDVVLMYKAQLIVAECKAEYNPFKEEKNYLGKLEAKANVLGGSYVSKIFITNQIATGNSSYKPFSKRAEQYKIVVVTGENLDEVGQILKREAERPTYPRI